MKIHWIIVTALAVISSACGTHDGHSHEIDSAKEQEHDHDHEELIELDSERAAHFGVETEVVVPAAMDEVVESAGEIVRLPGTTAVVTAPASGRVRLASGMKPGARVGRGSAVATISAEGMTGGDATEAAKIELRRAKAELDRVTPLRELGIVTAQEYAAAQNAYDLAVNAVSAGRASGAAASPIGGTVQEVNVAQGEYVEAGAPIATVANDEGLALRVDLPLSMHSRTAAMKGARFRVGSGSTGYATMIPGSMTTSGSRGYESVYFAIEGEHGAVAGDFAEVSLLLPQDSVTLSVPVGAVTERLGQKFVYVRHDADHFERRAVDLGVSDGERVAVHSGLSEGDEVVVKGATFVRLAETSGAVPEGHSHNH